MEIQELIIYALLLSLTWEISETASLKGCKDNGEILPHPTDQCSYIVCNYAATYDGRYGNGIVPVPRRCAPGTSVDTYEFDPYNPCSVTSDYCKPEFEIRYIGKIRYDVDKDNDVKDNKKSSHNLYKLQGQVNDIEDDKKKVKVIYKGKDNLKQGQYEGKGEGYAVGKYDAKYGKYEDFPRHGQAETEIFFSRPEKYQSDHDQHVESPKESETYGETETIQSHSTDNEKSYGADNPKERESYSEKEHKVDYFLPEKRESSRKPIWKGFEYDEIDYGKGVGNRKSFVYRGRNKDKDSGRSNRRQEDHEYETEKYSPSHVRYDTAKHNSHSRDNTNRYNSIDDFQRYEHSPKDQDRPKYIRRDAADRQPEKDSFRHENGHHEKLNRNLIHKQERSARPQTELFPENHRRHYRQPKKYVVVKFNAQDNSLKNKHNQDRQPSQDYERYVRNRHKISYDEPQRETKYINKYQTYNGY